MRRARRVVLAAACGVFALALVRSVVFIVVGRSMEPTLASGSVVIALPMLPSQRLDAGDVVVLSSPSGGAGLAVKRIVAAPGECVDAFGGRVRGDGNQARRGCAPLRDSEYFVLGDNPRQSTDSRSYGPVTRDLIVARVALQVWPLAQGFLARGFVRNQPTSTGDR